jgi:long-subunit acyl-CoA synthetase (AMP-forming)
MGVRNPNSPVNKNGRHPYEYKNFGWAIKKAIDFGAGMEHLKLCPEIYESMFGNEYNVKFMSIFSHNVENWYIIDLAIMLYGYTLAPLYATLGPETLAYVLNNT